MFLKLCLINWPNLVVWLALLREVLGNICTVIIFFPGCDVINVKINLIFLIKPILYMAKSQDKNLDILITKRAFKVK